MLAEILNQTRTASPLVRCISNYVSVIRSNASYRAYIIDALFHLDADALEEGANYEIC